MLAVRRGEVLGDADERIREGREWTDVFLRPRAARRDDVLDEQ